MLRSFLTWLRTGSYSLPDSSTAQEHPVASVQVKPHAPPSLPPRRKDSDPVPNLNPLQVFTIVGQVLAQVEAWVAGQPISITVPAETLPIDLSSVPGVGKVQVIESGFSLKIQKSA